MSDKDFERAAATVIADYDQKLEAEIAAWLAMPHRTRDATAVAVAHMQSQAKFSSPAAAFMIRMTQLGIAAVLAKSLERELQPCPTE